MSHAHPENRLHINFIDRLLDQVQHYARAIAHNPVAGDVHQLRVNLRRLKTGIAVLSFSGGNDELKDRFAEKIAPLFSAAGKLRDTQINQMMAGQLKLLNGFVASQKHRITSYNVCYTKLLREGLDSIIISTEGGVFRFS